MPIPGALGLSVETRKIADYLLNLDHPDGGPKARYLLGRGFTQTAPDRLRVAIEDAARTQATVSVERNPFGVKYVLQCEIETPSGRRPCVRTVWIDEGDGLARFVTLAPRERP